MSLIEKAVEVFSGTKLRESVTIYNHLRLHGLTMGDLAQYIELGAKTEREHRKKIEAEDKRREEKARKEWSEIAPACPECGAPLAPPNTLCGKGHPSNKKGWSCKWYCITGWDEDEPSGICGWEKYTHENAADEIKKLKERKK